MVVAVLLVMMMRIRAGVTPTVAAVTAAILRNPEARVISRPDITAISTGVTPMITPPVTARGIAAPVPARIAAESLGAGRRGAEARQTADRHHARQGHAPK